METSSSVATVQNNQLIGYTPDEIKEFLKAITNQHREISNLATPANEVKKDFNGMEYVEVSYMRRIANEQFPGWSFTIISQRTHIVDKFEVAFTTHGRLTWYDNGILRQGDMIASHANMFVYLKNKPGLKLGDGFTVDNGGYVINREGNKVPTGYLSVSNAWKSSVTECQKKAFNSYMNIADDVYRNVDVSLDEKVRANLIKIIQPIDSTWLEEEYGETVESMNDKILSGVINKSNVSASERKMNTMREDWDEKKEQWEKDNNPKK